MSTVFSSSGKNLAGSTATESISVLLADNNHDDRRRLGAVLREVFGERVSVGEAESGRAALDIFGRQQINVALIDSRLPDMDGLELITRMSPVTPQTATILLTRPGCEALAIQAIRYGVNDYLVKKSVDRQTLGRSICRALRRAKLDQEYTQSIRELRRSQHELNELLRSLSHDMNANMMLLENSFAGVKKSLGNRAGSEISQSVAHTEACLRESRRLLADLVLLAQTGRIEMEPARADVAAVVDEVLFDWRHVLAGRGVQVEVQRPLAPVWCNRHRLKQVISNLVANALKHGCDPERPWITISCSRATRNKAAIVDDPRVVSIRVEDNGPGIETAFREEVFLPGRRLRPAEAEGSGMGLAIVKKIVEHYGGTVRIDSQCTTGTAMVVSLPAPLPGLGRTQPHCAFPNASTVSARRSGHELPHSHRGTHPHPSAGRAALLRRP